MRYGLARESRAQGGTSTIDLLALLLGASSAVTASCFATLRQRQHDPTPIKGITEDAGATLTHKDVICDLRDAGYTPAEISVITCHAPHRRDRYLKTDLRVETLIKVLEAIPDDVQAVRFLGIMRSVVAQYGAQSNTPTSLLRPSLAVTDSSRARPPPTRRVPGGHPESTRRISP